MVEMARVLEKNLELFSMGSEHHSPREGHIP
jgi:hypothetical protein